MSEKFDAEAVLKEFANVETSVVHIPSRTMVTLRSLRSAAEYLKEHPSPGPAELHVHVPGDRIIENHEQLKAILDAV